MNAAQYKLFAIAIILIFTLLGLGVLLNLRVQEQQVVLSPTPPASRGTVSLPKHQKEIIVPPLTLEKLLDEKTTYPSGLAEKDLTELSVTGDILLARAVNYTMVTRDDFTWPFTYIAPIMRSADLTFINLENPFLEGCPVTNEGMVFCGDVSGVEGLTLSGVDVVSLANNHGGDQGQKGVADTRRVCGDVGISLTGIDDPVLRTVEGTKMAFLGYTDVTPLRRVVAVAEEAVIKKDIQAIQKEADFVVVALHWGPEYTHQPTPRQISLAHLAVDSGADIVVGNHPHWIQPIEVYKGKLIYYALGNTVMDQMWSIKTREGIISRIYIYEDQVVDIELIPLLIEDYGQPRILKGEEKENMLSRFREMSEDHQEISRQSVGGF